MGQMQTYNESNIVSILTFNVKLYFSSHREINDKFLIYNFKKTINALKQLPESEYYKKLRTRQLLAMMSNLAFLCETKDPVTEIINSGLHLLYSRIILFNLNKQNFDSITIIGLLGSLNHLTKNSPEFAYENIRNNFHKTALELLTNTRFIDRVKSNDNLSIILYERLIVFLNRNSMHMEGKKALISENFLNHLKDQLDVIDGLLNRRVSVKYMKLTLIGTIANILNDQEINTLPISQDIVSNYLETVKKLIRKGATNRTEFCKTKYYTTYLILTFQTTIFLSAILKDILSISINDTIKQNLFDRGALLTLEEILKNGNDDEIYYSIEILASLCFNENAAKYVQSSKELNKILQDIQRTTVNATLKNSCDQVHQIINNTLQIPLTSDNTGIDGHIMISYNHEYKEICLKIENELKKKGFITWMDVNSNITDLHDAMAEAVERSSIVLVCFAEEYKKSSNCRLEAEYAFKRNKKIIFVKVQPKYYPDGWLGLLLGSKLYADFSKDVNDQSFMKLFKLINNCLDNKGSQQDKTVQSSNVNSFQPQTHQLSNSNVGTNAKDWNKEEVKSWLTTNDMGELVEVFSNYSGKALKGLWEMKQKDYTRFCNTVDKQIQESNKIVENYKTLEFHECLQSLFDL